MLTQEQIDEWEPDKKPCPPKTPVETLTIKVNAKKAIAELRRAMADQFVEWVISMKLAWPIVLRLLEKDALSRAMLATELGEEGLRVAACEAQAQQKHDMEEGPDPSNGEQTWDDIMSRVVAEQLDTPGGRAEV